jgi:hypothetical protein
MLTLSKKRNQKLGTCTRYANFMIVFGLISSVFDFMTFATLRLAFARLG